MISKAIRLLGGILLIPVCIGYSFSFYQHLLSIRRVSEAEVVLLLGITAYLAFHVLIGSPSRAYVFGHELTHATAAWVSGGEVKGFKAGAKKGSVAVNKITSFIALAPYLLPVYAILLTIAYGVAGLFWDMRPWVYGFLFGLGICLAFHMVFTVEALKQKQSDLEIAGPWISLALIFWANLTLVLGVMSLIVPEVKFLSYLGDGLRETGELYRRIFIQLFR